MPKKQPFQKITNRELEILQLLWHTDRPLIASEIAALKPDLTINTVQAVLRNLLKYKYIEVAEIVYSGTVLSRSYVPVVSREEYLDFSCQKLSQLSSSSLVMASFIGNTENTDVLNELEAMIQKRKKELEEGE